MRECRIRKERSCSDSKIALSEVRRDNANKGWRNLSLDKFTDEKAMWDAVKSGFEVKK